LAPVTQDEFLGDGATGWQYPSAGKLKLIHVCASSSNWESGFF